MKSDSPIENQEQDKLGRHEFSSYIAKGILNHKSKKNLCIGLQGKWGTGKTSIINLFLQSLSTKTTKLPRHNRPIILKFSPWLVSGRDQLIESFFSELRIALNKPEMSEQAKQASKYLEVFEKILGASEYVASATPYGSVLKLLKKPLQFFKKKAKELENQALSLEENKERIGSFLNSLHSPLIVIIDDVDRLTNEEIRELFKLIKAVADFPNTIYFLAYDREVVERALEPFHGDKSQSYLEKIIQLEFNVPIPSKEELSKILLEEIQFITSAIPGNEDETNRWNELRFGPLSRLFRNVRDIKRFANNLSFVFGVIEDEISPVDLICMEAIRLFAPKLHVAIKENSLEFLSGIPSYRSNHYNEKEQWFNEYILSLIPNRIQKEIQEILKRVFPEIYSTLTRSTFAGSFMNIWGGNKRICLQRYFDHYFQNQLPEGEIAHKEYKMFLSNLHTLDKTNQYIRQCIKDARIMKLFRMIDCDELVLDDLCLKNLIQAIFHHADSVNEPPSEDVLSNRWAILDLVYKLFEKLSDDKKLELFQKVSHDPQSSIWLVINFSQDIFAEWHPQEGKPHKEFKLCSKENAEKFKDIALEAIQNKIHKEELHLSNHLLDILFRWRHLGDEKDVVKWMNEIVNDDSKLPNFLFNCRSIKTSTQMGSNFSTATQYLPKEIEKLINRPSLIVRARQLLDKPEGLSDNEKLGLTICIESENEKDF